MSNPGSTRAQFTKMTTAGDFTPTYVNSTNHLPSPSTALELDTPRAIEVVPGDGVATGAWAAGLFDCFDNLTPNCFMVTFCPCVALAQLTTRLGIAPYRVVLSLMVFVTLVELAVFTLIWTSTGDEDKTYKGFFYDSSEDLNKVVNVTFVVITLTVQLLLSVFIWYLRAKTRTRFELPGSVFMDWLSTWFCPCCTVAQLRTHVRCYQPGSCDFRAPDVLQAYPGKSYAV